MSRGHRFELISESMLANVIAFEGVGVPLKELKQAVGRGGGTAVGRGVVCLTPIQERLSEDDTRQLIERYGELVGDYSKGQVDREFIDAIKVEHDVSSKIDLIRSHLRSQGRQRS